MTDERPIEHPDLAKYPNAPTAQTRIQGVLYTVPIVDRREQSVPVRVEDVMQARVAVHQLRLLVEDMSSDDPTIEQVGRTITYATSDQDAPPTSHQAAVAYLAELHDRLNGSLPAW